MLNTSWPSRQFAICSCKKKFFLCTISGDDLEDVCEKSSGEAGMSTKKSPGAAWVYFEWFALLLGQGWGGVGWGGWVYVPPGSC